MIVTNDAGDATSQYYHVKLKQHNKTANLGLEWAFNTGELEHKVGFRTDFLNIETRKHLGQGSKKLTLRPICTIQVMTVQCHLKCLRCINKQIMIS